MPERALSRSDVQVSEGLYSGQASVRSSATPQAVFQLLTDLRSHLIWGGHATSKSQHLLSLDAPEGSARVGTEFKSVGFTSHGHWHDTSRVTEVTAYSAFEFVTDGQMETHDRGEQVSHDHAPNEPGSHHHNVSGHWVHRYEIRPDGEGCLVSYTSRWTFSEPISGGHHLRRAVFFHILLPTIWERGLQNLVTMAEGAAN
jgi:hypothetical protein